MTREDINNIISVICPNDEDYDKPIISPKYLKRELEQLALEQEPKTDRMDDMTREETINIFKYAVNGAKDERYISFLPTSLIEAMTHAIKVLEQEPCDDCISRAELLKAIDTWDKFGCDANTKLVPYKDHYVPYIHYDDVIKCIKGMPSVQQKSDVLDKIKAELLANAEMHEDGDYYLRDKWVSEIIDKYRQEG